MGRRLRAFVIILTAAILFNCSSPLKDVLTDIVKEYSTPTTLAYYSGVSLDSSTFTAGAGLAADSEIIINFSETMNTESLVLGGNSAEESNGGIWSATDNENDTLTISPATAWTAGSGRTITVDCSDLEDYPAEQLSVTFGVLEGIVYVHEGIGDDGNPGTAAQPKADISNAISLADYLYATAEVHVAEGTYRITTPLSMTGGISLYGAYSAGDWNIREDDSSWAVSGDKESAYPSILSGVNVDFVIRCSNLTNPITIDGFEIDAGTGDSTTGLYCENSSPIISGLKVNGGLGDSSTAITLSDSSDALINKCNLNGGTNGWSGALFIHSSSPEINGCIIDGGTSGTDSYTFGIYNISASPQIHGNDINGGSAWGQSSGIQNTSGSAPSIYNNTITGGHSSAGSTSAIVCSSSSPVVRNNTICGGNSTGPDAPDGSEGFFCYNTSKPVIENNIIFTTAGNNRIGMNVESGSEPDKVNNNNFFDCDHTYSVTATSTVNYTSIAAMESAIGAAASGNTGFDLIDGLDTYFISEDDDWHLKIAADVNVRQGGKDGTAESWSFTADKDGITRTNSTAGTPTNVGAGGWSMGAFEKD